MGFMSLRFSRKKKEACREKKKKKDTMSVALSPKTSVNRRERITEWKGTKNNGDPKSLEKKVILYKLDEKSDTRKSPLQHLIWLFFAVSPQFNNDQ